MFEIKMSNGEQTVTARGQHIEFDWDEGHATFFYYDMTFRVPIWQLDEIHELEEEDEEEGK